MPPTHVRQKMRATAISAIGLGLLTLLSTLALAGTARAATAVPLGSANNFAVLAGTTVTNTGPTVVNGDLGISPGTACTGFPAPCTGGPGIVNGTIHSADAAAAQAQLDLTAAYNNAAGQSVTTTTGTQLGGLTLTPGVYAATPGPGFLNITGTLTLDGQGDPNAVFIFQAASTLVTAAGPGASRVSLVNGTQACNVFWQVGSSAVLGTFSDFSGNILALTSIAAQTSAVINGRLLARNGATTLDSNTITAAQCATAATPDRARPTLTITNIPQECTRTNFKLKVAVSDRSGINHTDVFLDGKRVKRSSKKSFTVKIKANDLQPKRHQIRVVATDNAGNSRVRKASFQRCEPVAINFTG
ncbi:MAG: ice-binding family protein [Solirubrobacterales bacterium]